MIDLLLSILCSGSIFLIFKSFDKYKVDTFQAIVANYLVAFLCGILLDPMDMKVIQSNATSWLPWALLLGSGFIAMFYFIAITTQRISVSVATISTKMSVVIPVVAAVPLYGDSLPALKVLGILMALAGVVLASWKKEKAKLGLLIFLLPVILFLGNGGIDLALKYVQHVHLGNESPAQFSSIIFLTAGSIGLALLAVRGAIYRRRLDRRSLMAGIILGLPNFGSIYFLMKALASGGMQSSELFPINNMGIVLVSSFGAMLLFGEKGSTTNRIGILVSVLAIALISFHEKLVF